MHNDAPCTHCTRTWLRGSFGGLNDATFRRPFWRPSWPIPTSAPDVHLHSWLHRISSDPTCLQVYWCSNIFFIPFSLPVSRFLGFHHGDCMTESSSLVNMSISYSFGPLSRNEIRLSSRVSICSSSRIVWASLASSSTSSMESPRVGDGREYQDSDLLSMTTRVWTTFLLSDSGCTLPSEWLQPKKIWACSSLPALPVLLPRLTGSFFRVFHFAPTYICSGIRAKFSSVVDNSWIARKNIIFYQLTVDIGSSSLFPFPPRFSSSRNSQRHHSSSLLKISTEPYVKHKPHSRLSGSIWVRYTHRLMIHNMW